MKVRSLLFGMLSMLLLSGALTSCSDDDDNWNDEGSTVTLPQSRAYFLNEGTMGYNNAGIAFFAPKGDASFIGDIYKKQNGASLGDTGQDMIRHNDKIFVSVYGSNYIARLNAAGVEEARLTLAGAQDSDLTGGVRYLAAEGGYLYASIYGGWVAKIDINTLQVVSKLQLAPGVNLEEVEIENGNLYVASPYKKVDGKYVYLTEVYVIDLSTFKLKQTLTVTTNPQYLCETGDKLFLISTDYSRESYVLQQIDPANGNAVKEIGYATHMAGEDGVLYLADSRVDYSNWPEVSAKNSFSTYNVKSGTMSTFNLSGAPAAIQTDVIYMMAVDDERNELYIGATGHSNENGTIYRFKLDGTFIESFDCGGQNPRRAVFY